MSITIEISDNAAKFLTQLNKHIQEQDNRATASPYYFTVRCVSETPIPVDFADEYGYVDMESCHIYREDELKEYCADNDIDFDEEKNRCIKVGVKDTEEFKNFFFTEEGYKEHMRLNGHNYSRYKKVDSYVDHAYRNPEIEKLLAAVKEIAERIDHAHNL